MTLEQFVNSIATGAASSSSLSDPLRALWHERRGDWKRAHQIAQDAAGREGAWVHAYLHRKEGDLRNARYWYRRSGRPESEGTLEQEWESIVAALLSAG